MKSNLSEAEINTFKSGNYKKTHIEALFKSFDTNDLLVVTIEKNKSFLEMLFM